MSTKQKLSVSFDFGDLSDMRPEHITLTLW